MLLVNPCSTNLIALHDKMTRSLNQEEETTFIKFVDDIKLKGVINPFEGEDTIQSNLDRLDK